MNMLVNGNKIILVGKVKDITPFLASYPPEMTLQDLIKLKLH